MRPIRAVDSEGGWLMVEDFVDAFCSLEILGFDADTPSRIPGEELFRSGLKIHLVVSPCSFA